MWQKLIDYTQSFIIFFRRDEESLRKIRKMLSPESIDERHRRRLVNIHVTVIHWMTEFIAFFVVVLGSFVFGHGNATLTLCFQTTSNFFQFNLLPCVFLINHSDVKWRMAESKFYIQFLRIFRIYKSFGENNKDEEANGESANNEGVYENAHPLSTD